MTLFFWSSITLGVAALPVLAFGLDKSERDSLLAGPVTGGLRYIVEKFREARAMARIRMREHIFRRALRGILVPLSGRVAEPEGHTTVVVRLGQRTL